MERRRRGLRRGRGRGRAPALLDVLAARDEGRASGATKTRGDQLIERTADRLDELARGAASGGRLRAKLAGPLAEDAALVRGMRPGLIAARLRGKPVAEDGEPTSRDEPAPGAARGGGPRGGPGPLALAGAAFVLGLLLAKLVERVDARAARKR